MKAAPSDGSSQAPVLRSGETEERSPGLGLADLAFLLALPPIAYWVMHFHPMVQNRFLDPYIYTGYIHNFSDLVDRYGLTYYAVRFGFIVPGQFATAALGPIAGYFLYRYCLVLLATVPFYALAKQRFGASVAVGVSLLLATSPYLARTVLWDHPDASGVPFLFAAICTLLIEHPRRRLLDIGVGTFAGMAVHSNFFVIAPLAAFVGSYGLLWLLYRRGTRELVGRLLMQLLGLLLVTAAGSAYYWWTVGRWDIFSPTWSITLWLTRGGIDAWRTDGLGWITQSWAVLTPAMLSITALAARVGRRPEFHDAAMWLGSTGIAAFLYVHQLVLNGNTLELFYYFSYALPAIFILLALNISALWENRARQMVRAAVLVLVGCATVPWLLYAFQTVGHRPQYPTGFTQHLTIAVAACVLVLGACKLRVLRSSLGILATAALGIMFFSSFSTPTYAYMIERRREPSDLEMDVYKVALQFISAVPEWSREPGRVRFWYTAAADSSLNSIQSTFLWAYSKVQDEHRGLPYLGPAELTQVRDPELKWLALLAENPDELDQGVSALRANGIPHRRVRRTRLSSGTYTAYIELLEVAGTESARANN